MIKDDSYSPQSQEGHGRGVAKIRSVISTAKKQGRNVLQVLTQVLNGEVIVFS